jgi:hypothetical protein
MADGERAADLRPIIAAGNLRLGGGRSRLWCWHSRAQRDEANDQKSEGGQEAGCGSRK